MANVQIHLEEFQQITKGISKVRKEVRFNEKGKEDLRMSVDNDQLPFLIPAARKKREKMKLFFPRISFSL